MTAFDGVGTNKKYDFPSITGAISNFPIYTFTVVIEKIPMTTADLCNPHLTTAECAMIALQSHPWIRP